MEKIYTRRRRLRWSTKKKEKREEDESEECGSEEHRETRDSSRQGRGERRFSPLTSLSTRESVDTLRGELTTLDNTLRLLYIELHELRTQQEHFRFSRTCVGRLFTWLAYLFALYCLYKLVMSTVNLLFQRQVSTDPVTRVLRLVLPWSSPHIVEFWSQIISLAFIGLLIATTIRGFLKRLLQIVRWYSSAESSSWIALVLLHVMGMYFVSCVLLMRANLPEHYRRMLTSVLGPLLSFHFFHRWFDFIFIASALITLFIALIRTSSLVRATHI
jgi:hypothetical protein